MFGKGGVMVMLGGSHPVSPTADDGVGGPTSAAPIQPLQEIIVFDLYYQKWYSQTTSGDAPEGRQDFCVAGAKGANDSTYEIFVYGGWTGSFGQDVNPDSSDVYILTLPAFRWIRAKDSGSVPRAGSSCQVVGGRQMLSFGGWDPTLTDWFDAPDPWTYGIGIFDMTALKWTSGYNATADPYIPPDRVTGFYEQNSRYPSWDDQELQTLFTTANTASRPTSRPSNSSETNDSAVTSRQTNAGAIAGGVVGGIVFLTILACLWYFLRRKRRDHAKQHEHEQADGVPIPPELGPDGGTKPAELGPAMVWEKDSVPVNSGRANRGAALEME
ncbi:MAG: hypothetical protein M1833_001278 [Piccolia ochrophora]|nr:MAG: hypothetical protein M1833_001278 [Piccolia ochrophora]